MEALVNLVDTVSSHTGTGRHHGHHGQHQERHDDLHGVGDECDHLAHLHPCFPASMAAEPDDGRLGAIHDQVIKGIMATMARLVNSWVPISSAGSIKRFSSRIRG